MDFGRLATAMVTPFDREQRIDWQQTEKLIEFLITEQESDSLVVCGTTGESPTLSEEEKLKLFEFAVKQANGRCKIIAGTGSNDTQHSIHLTRLAEKCGVDGILLVNPYYNRPSQEGLYRHFRAIAESTELPVMLYNIPSRTGINVTAETTLRLAEIPNIVAVKESSGDLDQMTKIITGAPEGFKLYSGDDNLILPVLAIGGYGIVSVVSHIAGKRIGRLIRSYLSGDVQLAAQLHRELHPLFKGMFIAPNPVPIKHALALHGMEVGGVRQPLVEVSEEEARIIKSLFA